MCGSFATTVEPREVCVAVALLLWSCVAVPVALLNCFRLSRGVCSRYVRVAMLDHVI